MKDFDDSEIKTYDELVALLHENQINYDYEAIQKAYAFAETHHRGALRRSGDPVIEHLLSVAGYIARLHLDTVSVVVAILHEVMDIEHVTIERIDAEFGTEVAFIIDGITNMKNQTSVFSAHNEDPNNFRKLILAATEDIRILIVRLANKFHNLRTLHVLPVSRQVNQANKIQLVYAPLCEYLGLGHFQAAFENKAFEILHNDEYLVVKKYTDIYFRESKKILEQIAADILEMCNKYNIEGAKIYTRKKNYSSTYRKIHKKYLHNEGRVTPEYMVKIVDLLGLRVVTETTEECYMLLGLIHQKWEHYDEEFDDYITQPKVSGYKSIHTAIKYENTPAEIQIRTKEMHEFNEYGPASHIAYKLKVLNKKGESFTWTKNLVGWQDSDEFKRETFQVQAFSESVFVFTPKGKVIMLPKGSSPLDFAYAIHTSIGHRFTGALVNGKMVKMSYELQTGDIVEILTGNKPNVTPDWLQYIKVSETRKRIRGFLRKSGKWHKKDA